MAKLIKVVLIIAASIVGVGVVAAVAVSLFFDPNDYRETISAKVREATGREFEIQGDLSLTVFPWLAVEVGRTRLGNAEGFGDDPMLSFDSARLSVKLLPLIFERELKVGTAALEGFAANLAVDASGRSNWEDLAEASEASAAEAPADDSGGLSVSAEATLSVDIESVALSGARISYADAQDGSRYELTNANLRTGRIAEGAPVDIEGSFDFSAMPDEISGSFTVDTTVTLGDGMQTVTLDDLRVRTTVDGILDSPAELRLDSRSIRVDLENQRIDAGELDLAALGLNVSADVEPFSYAGRPAIAAAIRVADFSLKELLAALAIEPPVTADPNALGKVSFEAAAALGEEALSLSSMTLVLDDTTMTGTLAVPLTASGALAFDLRADSITLDNYMAPPSDEVTASDEGGDVEIPVELIRALRADGTVRLEEAFVGPVRFTNMQLGVKGADGRLRLHPVNASFFDGTYAGDVRIDASGDTPVLSLDENISNVSIASVLAALYDVRNVTGTVNASFVLSGSGQALSAVAADMDGNMRFELLDGVWQGVDVWHQLRTARAIYKREAPPSPRQPARTEFTSITASGPVTDGVFRNDDLIAQLPFLRVTGSGEIDFGVRELDYSVQARILETPEFMSAASEEEIQDFTEALIPIRISGPLGSPTFRPDIEGLFRQEVERAIDEKKEELQKKLLDSLLGGDDEDTPSEAAGEGAEAEPQEERDIEDELKDRLKDIFPR